MNLLKTILFALLIGLSLTSAGCYMDDIGPTEVVVYRSGVGYGYWYNSVWYPAPGGFIYHRGCRPSWGPRYYPAPHYYHPAPVPYHGGYGGYRGGYHGGFHGHR